ncbi:Ribonuclease H2 subunit C [Penicillium hispanicum]|uniref:Ribonuclease H2 subunit C n=1 Tax=Penicillium hispanicum TaxID=1080232 RepID=UPI00253FC58F|nr:Ribonuclease H2 subunit C [Penicillium hispanicum]KAJ5585451.1 Ribonuclease H2 subunit C [Penicillium hispanicum]
MPDIYTFQQGSQSKGTASQLTPNILPCQIHHDGPIESTERYWAPKSIAEDNTQTGHFRGRKLRGRRVAIPDGYQGVVATPTDRTIPSSQRPGGNEEENADAEPEEPVKVLETQGTFDEMIVWGHEILPAADDSFVKGVEEWIRFAETSSTKE